ncbi:hypothetical protein SCAB_48131 [Streptomyces scabiei 87.22]|uniref:Uncharacterized protein n=1 Tax=Streptomyces scabiei (strain 87.22) TaxID=680198 RepID=C9ZDU0_STRSW|nr:hypothetical protein [Streptomyces scabiei]MDX2892508.1 hypothetical protein [Streptomyces scabiei]MDX2900601.1 hypothetical protein [Streptomyces scabiei]MDX2994133.1 hypothetical protein [Streptomyces scabiei]MDX3084775.1 hypothetical protein [Streptomyces scabiei]MDX3137903.1 hypothetical protein [Streptomyces scabiei]
MALGIPVVRAETFYLPSHPQRPDAWALVAPAERVFRWYEDRVQRRVRLPDGFVIGQKAYARINHNRWVADCPCGSAQVVTPADPRMACTECGYGWLALTFPEGVAAVEASVADELPHLRNWWHPDDPVSWGIPPSDAVDPLGEEVSP